MEQTFGTVKYLLFFIVIIAAAVLALILAGWYPVVLVNGSPILKTTWEKAKLGAINFTNAQNRLAGYPSLNFYASDNKEILREVETGTLTFLIQDGVIQQEGPEILSGLKHLSAERAASALKSRPDLGEAAKSVYGLELDDFRDVVLLPQAREDLMKEALGERQLDFEEWLRGIKRNARVRLIFVPYQWDGEAVR